MPSKKKDSAPKSAEAVAVEEPGAPRTRLAVRKTYKLYVGGAFPRSESGRTYVVADSKGNFVANAAQASRKDARDAVLAARAAFGKWSGATAYNRGQIVYRAAEMLEGRRDEFVSLEVPAAEVDAAVDRFVWYAGWTDKIAQVLGGANPVAGPYFNLSSPEPSGIVAIVAPSKPSLLGLVSVIAPVIATGNTCIVISDAPRVAITLAEVFATSDLPGGVVNILTGSAAEIGPWLASHADVNGVDLTGLADGKLALTLEQAAADTLKRVRRPVAALDWTADPGLPAMTTFLETKTVWHPKGL
ncbi:aldehyde dehydrogenase family protein [Catellatospora sp. NEAU-YM18]|nr:aldehyde dehydrogenase family protein [Catellatospora tritici]